jgi:hypothetical protein
MAVPFGFSVGDFITVGQLIVGTTTLLRASRFSAAEYQAVLNELGSLSKTFEHLNGLGNRGGKTQDILDSIKFSAMSCRIPLEKFLNKMKKYDSTLGEGQSVKGIKTAARKIQFQFSTKDECQKLQNYLSFHISSINTLLLEYGLETMNLQGKMNEEDRIEIKSLILGVKSDLNRVSDDIECQRQLTYRALSSVKNMLDKITAWSGLLVRACSSSATTYPSNTTPTLPRARTTGMAGKGCTGLCACATSSFATSAV